MINRKQFTVFVLDDDPMYARLLHRHLSQNAEFSIEVFEKAGDLLPELYRNPDAITVDYLMPGINGLEAMKLIHNTNPELPVIIISGQEEIDTAVDLLKEGAFDYILKDSDTARHLSHTLQHIREIKSLKQQLESLKNEVVRKYDFSNTVLGKTGGMTKAMELIRKATLTNIPVSLVGESGTGKELVAKTIHYNSVDSRGAFISIDVNTIPPELIEQEIFGYEKGFEEKAITRTGKIEEAANGTLLIKNAELLHFNIQAKLLRFLEDKAISRLGSSEIIPVKLRIITANNRDLREAVDEKKFREDLYYKLLGLPIVLPSLRERGDDIILLANIFISEFCRQNNIPVKQLSAKAKAMLLRYTYPGNVRELRSLIELSVVLSEGDLIESKDINVQNQSVLNALIEKEKTLKEYEHEIVQHYLEKYEGNVLQVAEKLAIGKSTLYRMLKSSVLQQ